jgi:glycerol uptake facilitator-like aquaporin
VIARYNNISLALGVPGLILQIAGNVMMRSGPDKEGVGLLVGIIGTALLMGGLMMYARAKGRSPAWGLMGLLSIIGLIVLAMLEDRAPSGKARAAGRAPARPLGPGDNPPRR